MKIIINNVTYEANNIIVTDDLGVYINGDCVARVTDEELVVNINGTQTIETMREMAHNRRFQRPGS